MAQHVRTCQANKPQERNIAQQPHIEHWLVRQIVVISTAWYGIIFPESMFDLKQFP